MEAPSVRGKRKRPLCGWKRLVHCPTDETRATVGADEDMLGSVFCLVGLRRWVAGRIYWRLGCVRSRSVGISGKQRSRVMNGMRNRRVRAVWSSRRGSAGDEWRWLI